MKEGHSVLADVIEQAAKDGSLTVDDASVAAGAIPCSGPRRAAPSLPARSELPAAARPDRAAGRSRRRLLHGPVWPAGGVVRSDLTPPGDFRLRPLAFASPLYYKHAYGITCSQTAGLARARELGFALHDAARLLRTYADQRARELGTTRAQWAVLSRLQRCEGVKQNELAEALDLAPITLGRLIDKLAAAGLVERRDDAADRRANRLYLTEKAAPTLVEPRRARRGRDGARSGRPRRAADPGDAGRP